MAYKSANPALGKKTFEGLTASAGESVMTLKGTAFKSFVLLVLCISAGVFGWIGASQALDTNNNFLFMLFGSMILSTIFALITIFKKTASPVTAPLYALAEGFTLGAVSYWFNQEFSGIVLQALLVTAGIFVSVLIIYLTGIIRATENFKIGLLAATGGVALYYFAYLLAGLFGFQLPLVADTSVWGILFSVLVVIIAALNLVVDFDFIEQGVDQKAPKYMEWYSGFGLMVTIVWLYIELLRLISKARS